jgi:anti-sigma regulatory factor (Ser/Thr protein kinase)
MNESESKDISRVNIQFGSEFVSFRVPSSTESIGTAIRRLNLFLKHYEVSEQSASQAMIILRELLVNAITHGNKGNDATPVRVLLEHVQNNRFKIEVEDMGAGFNHAEIDTVIPDNPKAISNRGYALVKAYSDYFEFNDKGNRVSAFFSTRSYGKSV